MTQRTTQSDTQVKTVIKDVCEQLGFMPTEKVLVMWTFEIEGANRAISLMYAINKSKK